MDEVDRIKMNSARGLNNLTHEDDYRSGRTIKIVKKGFIIRCNMSRKTYTATLYY